MKLNQKTVYKTQTHEGGAAFPHMKPIEALRRSVMSCLLWEREAYEDGKNIADRIAELAMMVTPAQLSELAIEARKTFNLRHVPLLLAALLCKRDHRSALVSDTIAAVIQRADELAEFVAVYAHVNGVAPDKVKKKLSAQAKKGLAKAFVKFDAYQLGKYNRDGAIKLRDVLFLCHAKPKDSEQGAVWKQLVEGKLASPDTWEVALSAGADKKETFTRLLKENNLGYLALLRNLRNMSDAGVDESLIKGALETARGREKVLPFRFIAAARACPRYEPLLDVAMADAILALPKLKGRTVVLVDVSGSMDERLSAKSDLRRIDAAAALGSVVNAENLRVFTFSNMIREVAPRRGMAGVDAVIKSQPHQGTHLREALIQIHASVEYDRIIIITDEQTSDGITDPKGKGYLINVASAKNGVGYGKWTHLDGFSENVLRFITETEGL